MKKIVSQLEKITKEGYVKVGHFEGSCDIYQKEDEQLLYDRRTDEFLAKYNFVKWDVKKAKI